MPESPSEQRRSVSPCRKIGVGEVDLNGVGGAERLEDDVVVLERLGFFFGELSGLDELVDERLIARDLHEPVAAQDVAAAVADLREEQVVVDEPGDGGGRSHAAPGAVDLGLGEDSQSGRFDGADEPMRELVAIRGRAPFAHPLEDDVDGELAGDFARRGAAHAVANAEDGPCGPTPTVRSASSRLRVFLVRSATRKLSSLCSRICPTSVRPKSLTTICAPATPRDEEGGPPARASEGGAGCRPDGGSVMGRVGSRPSGNRLVEVDGMRPSRLGKGVGRRAESRRVQGVFRRVRQRRCRSRSRDWSP